MPKISDLRQLVSDLQQKEAEAMTKELLAQGLDPLAILEDGVVKGLTDLGDRFAAKKAIVLDLVKGGITAKACIPHIQAAFPKDKEVPKEKKIVLGTMLSQHNIGKNLVGTLLSIGGFEVIDIGEKNEPWDFYEKAEETGADMIAVSVVFSPAKQKFAELIDLLKQLKVREKYPVIVGGAVTSQRWAESEGADGWGAQAKDGVDLAKRLLEVA
jgi:5-methyltetrahydrofolate--homocysteine methyltransferase